MGEYETMQGDTWDSIALDFYDDEHLTYLLMEANPDYIPVLIFDAGIKLTIPAKPVSAELTLPPWKRGA